ncbi:Uncharacterised protein [Mycobacteroides abscessus subsp. abscessus]|nr:Uncharacterised protein [Mycobacteroides abscessus subsp. abscessus]
MIETAHRSPGRWVGRRGDKGLHLTEQWPLAVEGDCHRGTGRRLLAMLQKKPRGVGNTLDSLVP